MDILACLQCLQPHRAEDNPTLMPPYCSGDVGHDGACDDVGPVPVGWPRGQLSDCPTFFRDSDTMGHALWGVLSTSGVSVRGCLPPRGRRSRCHQSLTRDTHGLDRFFASLYGKPVPGLAFFTLVLVSVQARRSFPRRVEQVVRSDAEKATSKAKAAAKKAKALCTTAAAWASKGQQEYTQSQRALDAGVIAYYRLARRLAAPDRLVCLLDLHSC